MHRENMSSFVIKNYIEDIYFKRNVRNLEYIVKKNPKM